MPVRIAVCSLSQFTYVVKLIDAAARLNEEAEVRYFSGWRFEAAARALRDRGLAHEVLHGEAPAAAMFAPARAKTAHDVFASCFFAQAERTLPALIPALRAFAPDIVAVHMRDYAGMVAADVLGVPWVSFGSFASPIRDRAIDPPFGAGVRKDASAAARRLAWRLHDAFHARLDPAFNARFRRPFGLAGVRGVSSWCSPHLVLSTLVPSLSNKLSSDPARMRYVGPLFSRAGHESDERTLAAIDNLPRPRLLLSLGTSYAETLTERCIGALRELDCGLVVSLGRPFGEKAAFADPPETPRRLVRPFFSDLGAVLERVDGVISVGAGQTVMEALRYGRPLACLPQQGEQRDIALAVEGAGAGRAVFGKWDERKLRDAVREVGSEPRYPNAAANLAQEIAAAGGPGAAARALVDVVAATQR